MTWLGGGHGRGGGIGAALGWESAGCRVLFCVWQDAQLPWALVEAPITGPMALAFNRLWKLNRDGLRYPDLRTDPIALAGVCAVLLARRHSAWGCVCVLSFGHSYSLTRWVQITSPHPKR